MEFSMLSLQRQSLLSFQWQSLTYHSWRAESRSWCLRTQIYSIESTKDSSCFHRIGFIPLSPTSQLRESLPDPNRLLTRSLLKMTKRVLKDWQEVPSRLSKIYQARSLKRRYLQRSVFPLTKRVLYWIRNKDIALTKIFKLRATLSYSACRRLLKISSLILRRKTSMQRVTFSELLRSVNKEVRLAWTKK